MNHLNENSVSQKELNQNKQCDIQIATSQYFASLESISRFMTNYSMNDDYLFDKDNQFLEAGKIIQLATTPACINIKKRKKVQFNFECVRDERMHHNLKILYQHNKDRIKHFEKRVLSSLNQGIALGNTFYFNQNTRHINTIVGMRFSRKECQLKIRESQNGRSQWHSMVSIYNKVDVLTELRRL